MQELLRQISALQHIDSAYRAVNPKGKPTGVIRVSSKLSTSNATIRSIAQQLGLKVKKALSNPEGTAFNLLISHSTKAGGAFHILLENAHDEQSLEKPRFRISGSKLSHPVRGLALSFFEALARPRLRLVK